MAYAVKYQEDPYFNAQMRGPFIASSVFHLAVFLVSIFGLPLIIPPKPTDLSVPISIEVVDIADIAQTNKVAKPIEKIEKEDKPIPKVSKPSPPEVEETPPEKIEEPPKDIEKPKNELAPPDKAKPEEKQKPAPKKPPVKAEKKKEEPKDFNSLLKNLAPDAEVQKEKPETMDKVLASATEKAQDLPLGERMTMTEMDALRRQLGQCWNVMAGAKYAENLVVEVRVVINPDRTVKQATIINQVLYNTDSYFRAAADAAVRAFYNPKCIPLALPPDKYNDWKTTTIVFDPSQML